MNFKKVFITLSIIFVAFTSFFAGLLFTEVSSQSEGLRIEVEDLVRKTEAIDQSFEELVDFELLELSVITNLLFEAKVRLEEIHLRYSLNNSGVEFYGVGDYQSDVIRVVESLKRADDETRDTSGYFMYQYFELFPDKNLPIPNQGYIYNISYLKWNNLTSTNPVVNELTLDDFLTDFFVNWNQTVKNDVQNLYTNGSVSNFTFVEYNNLAGFYELIREDYNNVLNELTEKKEDLSSIEQLAGTITNIVSFMTVATVLTTYISTSLENQENEKTLAELQAGIKIDPSEIKSSSNGLLYLILLVALVFGIIGIFLSLNLTLKLI
jgi:hypothetical protein